MRKVSLFLLLALLSTNFLAAQEVPSSVKITGIVVAADSLNAIPFTTVTIRNSPTGTASDNSGYFAIFANALDTIVFSNVGYATSTFVVPPNLPEESYGLVHVMHTDTVMLEEIVVFPWPTAEDFGQAFLAMGLKENHQTRSFEAQAKLQQNLDQQLQRERYYYDQMRYNRLYNLTGTIPPNNFLNPITWSNFVRSWRSKAFDIEDEEMLDFDY